MIRIIVAMIRIIVAMVKVIILKKFSFGCTIEAYLHKYLICIYLGPSYLPSTPCCHGNVTVHILEQMYTTHYCMERISMLPMYIRNTGRHAYATADPVIIADISNTM